MGCFAMPTAVFGFFLSSWLMMIFWGIIMPDLGVATIGYPKAMLITVAIWLVIGPLVTSGCRKKK